MFQRFITWLAQNSTTLIAPVASCISALAAMASVFMATKTFRQARRDRREELVAKHPKFRIIDAQLVRQYEVAISTWIYELRIEAQNVNANSARAIDFTGAIYRQDQHDCIHRFNVEPTGEIIQDESVSITTKAELETSSVPYFLILHIRCADSRTTDTYSATHYRKFYINGGSPVLLEKTYKKDIRDLADSRRELWLQE